MSGILHIFSEPFKIISAMGTEGIASSMERRYVSHGNQLYLLLNLFAAVTFAFALILYFTPYYKNFNFSETFSRTFFGLLSLQVYLLFLKLKRPTLGRFALCFFPLSLTYYLPLFTQNIEAEYFVRGPYQPIAYLIFCFWCFHPKAHPLSFWLCFLFPLPFTFATPYLTEFFSPGSTPDFFKSFHLNLTIPSFCYYITAAIGLWHLINKREMSLEQLTEVNQILSNSVEENNQIQKKLQEELNYSDQKIDQALEYNSHQLRAPISNLQGVMEIIDFELQNNQAELPDKILGHLKHNIEALNKSVENINERLEASHSSKEKHD